MADDVTLEVKADTGKAKTEITSLRGVIDEFLRNLGVEGTARAKQFGDAMEAEFTKAGTSVEDLKGTLTEIEPVVKERLNSMGDGAQATSLNFKDLSKNIIAGFSIISVLRANLADLEPSFQRLGVEVERTAKNFGVEADVADVLVDKIKALLNPKKLVASINADIAFSSGQIARKFVEESSVTVTLTDAQKKLVDAKREALRVGKEREAAIRDEQAANEALAEVLANTARLELQNGEVSKRTRAEIEQLNQAYFDSGDKVPPKLALIVAELGILTDEQEKAGKEAERLAERSEKAADRRAKAEEKAAERIKTAMEREAAARDKAVADAEKRVADLESQSAAANQPQGNPALEQVNQSAAELKAEIKAIEDSPIITLEQQNRLDEAKNQLLNLTRAAADLAQVQTVVADNFLDEAQAAEQANANIELAIALSKRAYEEQSKLLEGQQASAKQTALNREELERLEGSIQQGVKGSFTDLTEAAEQASETIGDAANSATELGKEGKKAAEETTEGLGGMKEQAVEVNAELLTTLDLLARIKAAAAEIDI